MFAVKLLANLAIVTLFWRCLNTFSHFTFHMSLEVSYYNWSLLKAVHVFYVNVQFKRTNQGCSPSKLANQSMLNGVAGDKNGQEKLWSFDKARNVLVEKTKARAVKNILPLDFARYLGYSEV